MGWGQIEQPEQWAAGPGVPPAGRCARERASAGARAGGDGSVRRPVSSGKAPRPSSSAWEQPMSAGACWGGVGEQSVPCVLGARPLQAHATRRARRTGRSSRAGTAHPRRLRGGSQISSPAPPRPRLLLLLPPPSPPQRGYPVAADSRCWLQAGLQQRLWVSWAGANPHMRPCTRPTPLLTRDGGG